jgi:serine/threonine-protein kinase RsbT
VTQQRVAGRAPDDDVAGRVMEVLGRYVSAPTARSVLELALRKGGVASGADLDARTVTAVFDHVRRGLALFVRAPEHLVECSEALNRISGTVPGLVPGPQGAPDVTPLAVVVVAVRGEDDVLRSRTEVRGMAERLGFSEVGRTRLATAVSELARNIVRYASAGFIELRPQHHPARGVEVVATDDGPGIAELTSVLAGTYRSRHGMGLGLRGVRRLAQHFEVQTAPGRGTRVLFRMVAE